MAREQGTIASIGDGLGGLEETKEARFGAEDRARMQWLTEVIRANQRCAFCGTPCPRDGNHHGPRACGQKACQAKRKAALRASSKLPADGRLRHVG